MSFILLMRAEFPIILSANLSHSWSSCLERGPIPALTGCPSLSLWPVPSGALRPPPAHHVTQSLSCTLALCFFKNRLGYLPGQPRDLDTSWGLRNVSETSQILHICVNNWLCVQMFMRTRERVEIDAAWVAKQRIFCPDERVERAGDELLGRRVPVPLGQLLLRGAAAPVLWWVHVDALNSFF